jgi:UMF1 family MFS transporter
MMPALVPADRLGRLSGNGWAVGYIGGLVSLIVTLGWLAADPQTDKTMLGFPPILDHRPGLHLGNRATGPLTAIWFIVFALPLFLFTPHEPPKLPVRDAFAAVFRCLGRHSGGCRGIETSRSFCWRT